MLFLTVSYCNGGCEKTEAAIQEHNILLLIRTPVAVVLAPCALSDVKRVTFYFCSLTQALHNFLLILLAL